MQMGAMVQHLECEVCGALAVRVVRRDPADVWHCARCGNVKRWCPRCRQGWVRRLREPVDNPELYSCEECEATWRHFSEIQAPGEDLRTFLRRHEKPWSYAHLVPVREAE